MRDLFIFIFFKFLFEGCFFFIFIIFIQDGSRFIRCIRGLNNVKTFFFFFFFVEDISHTVTPN